MQNEKMAYDMWKRVDTFREQTGYNLEHIATIIGVKYQTIKDQRSKNMIPKTECMYKMALLFNTTIEYLLTGKEERIISIADEVYEYMQTEMPSLLEDIMRKISLKKEAGFSGNRA